MKKKAGENQNGRERDKPGKSELILYQTDDGKTSS